VSAQRILVVDDDEQICRLVVRLLASRGFECVVAGDAGAARERLADERFPLVLCDIGLPGESGIELVTALAEQMPETVTLMLTGNDDPALAETAFDLGAYGYILKPFDAGQLLIGVANALRRRDLELESRSQRERLEQTVIARTYELGDALAVVRDSELALRRSQEETVHRLSRALEYSGGPTDLHVERMSCCCGMLADHMRLDDEHVELVRVASSLHDVGQIAVADSIFNKPGPLSPEERALMERHTEIGYEILAGSGSELLGLAATIALTHHERFDGSGYPRGLSGEEIPLEGRLAAVADVFDAIAHDRPYRPRFAQGAALDFMRAGRGTMFDPEILDLFLDLRGHLFALAYDDVDPAEAA
jgi:putative two-component system response regulator